jgi:hypothetical protein
MGWEIGRRGPAPTSRVKREETRHAPIKIDAQQFTHLFLFLLVELRVWMIEESEVWWTEWQYGDDGDGGEI